MGGAIFNDQRHPLNRVGADTACARSRGPWDYRYGCSNGSMRGAWGRSDARARSHRIWPAAQARQWRGHIRPDKLRAANVQLVVTTVEPLLSASGSTFIRLYNGRAIVQTRKHTIYKRAGAYGVNTLKYFRFMAETQRFFCMSRA